MTLNRFIFVQCQEEVRSLICLVTRDNLPATEQLCNLLSQRITLSLMGHAASQDHNNSVTNNQKIVSFIFNRNSVTHFDFHSYHQSIQCAQT